MPKALSKLLIARITAAIQPSISYQPLGKSGYFSSHEDRVQALDQPALINPIKPETITGVNPLTPGSEQVCIGSIPVVGGAGSSQVLASSSIPAGAVAVIGSPEYIIPCWRNSASFFSETRAIPSLPCLRRYVFREPEARQYTASTTPLMATA